MPEYVPSPRQWVRDQVERSERSGGTEGTSKTPPRRVKDGARYVLVGPVGGAPTHPVWV